MILFGFGKRSEEQETTPARLDVSSVTVSETGLVRTENQDRVFVDDLRGVYCVADGMGGGEEGARASEIVCRNLKMVLSAAADTFSARVAAVQKAILDANEAIRAYVREKGFSKMASTVAVLVVDPANHRHVAVCNVGDSRIYRIRGGMPELLTHDHRRTREDNTLTRAVGGADDIKTDWSELTSDRPSRFILCTDGVHDVQNSSRLAVFVAAGTMPSAAARLKADILRQGAPDNFSFILVEA